MASGLNRTTAIGIALIVLSFCREILGVLSDIQGGLSVLQSVGILNFLGSPIFRLAVLLCGLLFLYVGYRLPNTGSDPRIDKAKHIFEFQLLGCFRSYVTVIESDLFDVEHRRGAASDKVPLRLVWALVNEKDRKLCDLLSQLKRAESFADAKALLCKGYSVIVETEAIRQETASWAEPFGFSRMLPPDLRRQLDAALQDLVGFLAWETSFEKDVGKEREGLARLWAIRASITSVTHRPLSSPPGV